MIIKKNTVGVSTGHGQPSHMGNQRGHTDKPNEYYQAVNRGSATGTNLIMADKQQK